MKQSIVIILFVLSIATFAQAPHGHEWLTDISKDLRQQGSVLLNVHTSDDGTRTYLAVTADQIAKSPRWDGNGEPPLTLTRAVVLARAHLKKKHPQHDTFPLTGGSFTLIQSDEKPNRWFYSLDFKIKTHVTPDPPSDASLRITEVWKSESFSVNLMMDGTILSSQPVKKEKSANK